MSALQVLQSCPSQRKYLLSALGVNDDNSSSVIKFETMGLQPRFPYVAAATILPIFHKFWIPSHDFALIVKFFELLVCVLIFNGYKSLTLDQDSDFDCVRVYGGWQMFSLILLVDQTSCSVLWVTAAEV